MHNTILFQHSELFWVLEFEDAFICLFNSSEISNVQDINFPDLMLFPNPTNYILNIIGFRKGNVKIFNLTGQLLLSTEFWDDKVIDLSAFSNSLLKVQIEREGIISRHKLLKR